MKRNMFLVLLILTIDQCLGQNGFPKQFQTTLNISGSSSAGIFGNGVQQLLYDYDNLRARIDVKGWRAGQKEAYVLMYKPEGAEADSPASQGYAMFNFNPDYPQITKNDCWYGTDSMSSYGPFPPEWFYDADKYRTQIQPWFPLPANMINKGEEWIPEIEQTATRYDSQEMCNLKRSGIGLIPCLSYFEIGNRPVKTLRAHAAVGSYDADEIVSTVYLTFTQGIPPAAESLFNLPDHWPTYCGNANAGFTYDPMQGFVVTPEGQDHFMLKLKTPPIRSLGDEVQVEFKAIPNWYYNGTKCVQFPSITFNTATWQEAQRVDMTFDEYGCCTYAIIGKGGGYEWQYTVSTLTVYACDGEAGYGCKGKSPCGG